MQLERFAFRAMGSPCELQVWAKTRAAILPDIRACLREIDRLEKKFSRYRDDSLATAINQSAGSEDGILVDDETASLLDFATTAHRESQGRFDPSSGVLRQVWNFKSGRLPEDSAIEAIRERIGWDRLRWERPRLVLPIQGMEIDFGGFVKEYAADRVAQIARDRGLRSGLVDLGGDMAAIGPHPDGSAWLIGIRDPRHPERAIARIALSHGGLATSGDYERCMIVDGRRYSHLLDPRTGRPIDQGPACVSVSADHCLIAGVTSTIAMLHRESESEAFLSEVGLPYLCVGQDGNVRGPAHHIERGREGRATPTRISSAA